MLGDSHRKLCSAATQREVSCIRMQPPAPPLQRVAPVSTPAHPRRLGQAVPDQGSAKQDQCKESPVSHLLRCRRSPPGERVRTPQAGFHRKY